MNENPTHSGKTPRGVRRGQNGRFESALPGDKRPVLMHLSADLVDMLDRLAADGSASRSVTVERLLAEAVAHAHRALDEPRVEAPRIAIARSQSPLKKFKF
jgi:hypothetical protein